MKHKFQVWLGNAVQGPVRLGARPSPVDGSFFALKEPLGGFFGGLVWGFV